MEEIKKIEISFFPKPPRLAVLVASALALFLFMLAVNEGITVRNSLKPKTERTISLSAEGKVSASPDTARFELSVLSEAKKPKDAQADNTKKMNAIIDFLKSQGVDAKDLKTSAYSLNPKYYYPYDYPRIPCPMENEVVSGSFSCPPKFPLIIGYEANQTLDVKVRNLELAGALLDGAVSNGANQAGGIQFFIDEPDKYKAEAREKAFQNAKEKAEVLAKTAGVRLGKVVTFFEGQISVPSIYRGESAFLKASDEGGVASAPSLEPGSQDVSVTVNVVFEIK